MPCPYESLLTSHPLEIARGAQAIVDTCPKPDYLDFFEVHAREMTPIQLDAGLYVLGHVPGERSARLAVRFIAHPSDGVRGRARMVLGQLAPLPVDVLREVLSALLRAEFVMSSHQFGPMGEVGPGGTDAFTVVSLLRLVRESRNREVIDELMAMEPHLAKRFGSEIVGPGTRGSDSGG